VRLTDDANKGVDLTPILHGLPSAGAQSSGTVRVGPDGKLYVSVADNDRGANAQDLNSLAGKILRVNTDGSIPDDNPFAGQAGKQGAIWAYGFHDLATFAFDPVGHELLAADNGAKDHDELDLIVRGGNYGFPPAGFRSRSGVVDPIAVTSPSIRTSGSTFYSGDQLGNWTGDWFACDQEQQQLRRVRLAPLSLDRVVFEEVVKQGCAYDVVAGPDGALYYSDARGIYRIRSVGADALPAVKLPEVAPAVPSPSAASR
jgi:glucose/arabinose dehydrogenase